MPIPRILRTTTFRIVLAYLALFSVSALALLGFVYVATTGFMERQTRETIAADMAGLAEQYRAGGLAGLHRTIQQRSAAQPQRASVYLLTDPVLRPLAGNLDRWPDRLPDGPGEIELTVEARPHGEAIEMRRALARSFELPGGYRLLVGRDIEDRLRVEARIGQVMVLGTGLTLLLGLAGGLLLARPVLRRIDAINRATREIMAGDLARRIATTGTRDELDELAGNLNAMLARIEQLIAAMREVSDNVAHDLRTPLGRMRNRIELALMSDLAPEHARAALETTLADADGLIRTFNALLDIARAESGALRDAFQPLALAEIARDVAELYRPSVEEGGRSLSLEIADEAEVAGHPALIAQALANLVDNAIKHMPAGGRLHLRVDAGPPPALEVVDDGPGIPVGERSRVLERFVRLDADRSQPGNGLGLALVSAVARLHGARLELGDADPGLRVRLEFPTESPRRRPEPS